MPKSPFVKRNCAACGREFVTADPSHDRHCSRACVVKAFGLGEYDEEGSSYKVAARKRGGEMRYVDGEGARVQGTLEHHGGFHGRDDQ